MTTSPTNLTVVTADEVDRPTLEQLWNMFRHDMSAFTGSLPDGQGRFRQERLDAALTDADWHAYLFRLGPAAVGFAVVRGLASDERIISSFFIVRGARRSGIGRAAAKTVTRHHPGHWTVAFQDTNAVAFQFWQALADDLDNQWTLEHRDVPGRPDLPSDAWARFTVR